MFFRFGITFFLFITVAGIGNIVRNANQPGTVEGVISDDGTCEVEVQVINDAGDATEISANGNTIDVRGSGTNLGGSYREYAFTVATCLTGEDVTLSGTFVDGKLCEPNGQGAVVSAYENNTVLTIRQKDNGDGTCSYVVTR